MIILIENYHTLPEIIGFTSDNDGIIDTLERGFDVVGFRFNTTDIPDIDLILDALIDPV